MTMTKVTTISRHARNLAAGALVLGAATVMLPSEVAAAAPGPHRIAERLDHIAYQVQRIPEIRGLRNQDAEIDRLQRRLHRLENITERQRGRRARLTEERIDRLQYRLSRMERRVEARLERRRDYRHGHWHDHSRNHWRNHWRHDDRRDWRDGRFGYWQSRN